MRIGIIRLGSLGDIIHALPALSALRGRFPRNPDGHSSDNPVAPDNRIEWLVESAHRDFLEGHPLLDAVHVLDTKKWRRFRKGAAGPVEALKGVRRSRFDAVLDFQGLLKSAVLARWTGAGKRIGFDAARCRESAAANFYTHRVAPPEGAKHVIEMNLSLLGPLGIEGPVPIEFPLGVGDAERRKAADFFAARGWSPEVPVVALCPGAGWETKRWGVEKFAAVGDRLFEETEANVLWLWGPGEEALIQGLRRSPRAPAGVIPSTSVREMAAFLERCRMFIGGDTGPLHLAAALGVPTVAVMGPTTPSRNGPVGPGGVQGAVVHHELPCSHCYQRTCPGFGTRCLAEMTVDEVAAAALETWRQSRPSADVGAAAEVRTPL